MKIFILSIGFLIVAASANPHQLDERILLDASGEFDNYFEYVEARGLLENKLLAGAENLRKTLREGGDLTQGVVMDPWFLETVDANVDLSKFANLTGELAKVTVDGLSSFTINDVNINIFLMKCHFNITFDHLMANGLYDIEGTIADFAKLFGKGLFDIKLHNINAVGHVKLRLKGISGLEMTEFNLMPSIESMKLEANGLMGNPNINDMIMEILNDALPKIIVKHKADLATEIEKIVKNFANPILENMTITDLINMFG